MDLMKKMMKKSRHKPCGAQKGATRFISSYRVKNSWAHMAGEALPQKKSYAVVPYARINIA
jgi:hypothetical protein